VKMSIADPQNLLRAGMNTNVEFDVGSLSNVLVIPTVAIVRQEEGTGVLMASKEAGGAGDGKKSDGARDRQGGGERSREGGQPGQGGQSGQGGKREGRKSRRFRPIETGITVNDKTVVRSGLKEGDKVLISFPDGERPPSRTPSLMPGMERRGR
jgi:HlyD family secretion protein